MKRFAIMAALPQELGDLIAQMQAAGEVRTVTLGRRGGSQRDRCAERARSGSRDRGERREGARNDASRLERGGGSGAEGGGPPRASQPKKRVVPRRSRWPSLVAALNYWSPKPL